MEKLEEHYQTLFHRLDLLCDETSDSHPIVQYTGDSVKYILANGLSYFDGFDGRVRVGSGVCTYFDSGKDIEDKHFPVLKRILLELRKGPFLEFWADIPHPDLFSIQDWSLRIHDDMDTRAMFMSNRPLHADGTKVTPRLTLRVKDGRYVLDDVLDKVQELVRDHDELHRKTIPPGSDVLYRNQSMKVTRGDTKDSRKMDFLTSYTLKSPAGAVYKGVSAFNIKGIIRWGPSYSKRKVVI